MKTPGQTELSTFFGVSRQTIRNYKEHKDIEYRRRYDAFCLLYSMEQMDTSKMSEEISGSLSTIQKELTNMRKLIRIQEIKK